MRKLKCKNVTNKTITLVIALTITLSSSNISSIVYANELNMIEDDKNIDTKNLNNKEILTSTITNEDIFDLRDWDFNIYTSDIILNKYKGTKTDLVIPGNINVTQEMIKNASNYNPNAKQKEGIRNIKMGTISSTNHNDCFRGYRDNITSLKFVEIEGKKVSFSVNSSTGRMYKDAFNNLKAMRSIDLSGVDVATLPTDMSSMFSGCSSLEAIDLRGINLSQVTKMSNMFNGCSSLKIVDLSGINLELVNDMSNIFKGCSSLVSVNLSNTILSSLKSINNIFTGLTSLEEVNLNNTNMSNVLNAYNMFSGCNNLKSVNLDNLDISKVQKMYKMFENCTSLESIDLSKLTVKSLIDLTSLFLGCKSLNNVTLGGNFDTSKVIKFSNMFKDCINLKGVDLSELDTTNATDMSYMFSDTGIEIVDLSKLNTSKLLNLSGIFRNTKNLNEIIFGYKFDTSSVTNMSYMFSGSAISNLDLSRFNTKSVINTTAMFALLDNLEILDLTSFNLNDDTDVSHMFATNITVNHSNGEILPNPDAQKKELLIISSDDVLKRYNYKEDGRLPVGLTLDANGGTFTNGQEILELKTNIVDKLNVDTLDTDIQNVLNKIVPIKENYQFSEWEAKTKSNDIFDKLNSTYVAKWNEIASTPNDDVDVPNQHEDSGINNDNNNINDNQDIQQNPNTCDSVMFNSIIAIAISLVGIVSMKKRKKQH